MLLTPTTIDLDHSADRIAAQQFSGPQIVATAPLEPGLAEQQNRRLAQAVAKPEIHLTSFRRLDPLEFLKRKPDLKDLKGLQVKVDKGLTKERKKEISALVEKLYEVKVLGDKDLKTDLKNILEYIESDVTVKIGNEEVKYLPERFTNAVHLLKVGGVLTTEQMEKFIFKSDNKPFLAALKLISLSRESRQELTNKLPEGFKPHQVKDTSDPKVEKLYRDTLGEIKLGLLEKYGIK